MLNYDYDYVHTFYTIKTRTETPYILLCLAPMEQFETYTVVKSDYLNLSLSH
jgi:hypothetical protein